MSEPPIAGSNVAVTQNRYDRQATGANLQETVLNTSNVNSSSFGRLFSYAVQGNVVAQPLYLPQVSIPGKGIRNLLFIATMKDHVYCFDADSNQGSDGGKLWEVDFVAQAGAGAATFPPFDATGVASEHLDNSLGILSTPIIDRTTNTMYLVVNTKEATRKRTRLHALDVTNGTERPGSPVSIAASFSSASGQVMNFDTQVQLQRAGLALSGTNLILAFSSHDDVLPNYQGWVIEFNKTGLQRTGTFVDITAGGTYGGGIWMAGRPPVVDDQGFVYVFTGNGIGANGYDGVNNFSESVLKLNPAAGLAKVATFTPSNWATLDGQDWDLASSGPILIPGTNVLMGGGKEGVLYTLDTTTTQSQILGLTGTHHIVLPSDPKLSAHIMGGPVFWPRSAGAGGSLLFNSGENDVLRAFQFNGTDIVEPAVATSNEVFQGHPAGIAALSANGEAAGSGVLWVYSRAPAAGSVGGVTEIMPGILRAYDAANVNHVLWTNQQSLARDDAGLFGKFSVPTVVNGKVYIGTNSNQAVVYSPLPTGPALTLKAYPARNVALGRQAVYTVAPFRLNGYGETLSYSVTGLPASTSASFGPPAADGSVKMTVTTSSSTPNGLYLLTVTATGSTQSRSQGVLLEVEGSVSIPPAQRRIRAVDSEEPLANNLAVNVLDQNASTFWATQWVNASPGQPHFVDIDLGGYYSITGFSYLPRQDGCANGAARRFEAYVSLDAITWGPVMADGSYDYETAPLDCSGSNPGRLRRQNVLFREAKVGHFLRFVTNLEVSFNPWTTAAELDVFTNGVASGTFPSNATQVHAIRGTDGTGWMKTYANGWSHFDTILGGLVGDPAVVGSFPSWDLFVQGTNGEMWTASLASGVWTPWWSLGCCVASRPSAVETSSGQIDVIIRGTDNGVWAKSRIGGNWSGWSSLSGSIVGDPALVLLPDGTESAFALGANEGAIWTNTKTGSNWSGWTPLTVQPIGRFKTQPSAVVHGDGRIDLFAIGQDNATWTIARTGSTWGTSWQSLSGNCIGSQVTPIVDDLDDVSVFVLGADTRIWQQRRSSVSGQWTGFVQIGTDWSYTSTFTEPAPGAFADAPRAVADGDGQLQLTVIGTNPNRIYQNRRLNNAWGLWVPAN
jgi:hypothetical protein